MKNPFDRSCPDESIEAALRESLTEHARHAPAADVLAERIIAAVEHQPSARDLHAGPRRGWRSFALPAVAAAAVAAVVGIVVAVEGYHPNADRPPAAQSPSIELPASTSVPARSPSPSAQPTSESTRPGPVDTSTLHGVQIVDLTFTGADAGWGLGTAACIRGSGRCTALLRTTDGSTWTSRPNTPFNVAGDTGGCAAPCVAHLRFANDEIGYAFGPDTLFVTTDGAQTWHRQPGGADALETLNGTVIRVRDQGGCPPGCSYRVETAPIGSTSWHPVPLPGAPGRGVGVQLGRVGHEAFLEDYGNQAGGGPAAAVLYTSADDGATWTNRGEPCRQGTGNEVVSEALTTAPDGSVTIACVTRGTGPDFTTTSSDGGMHFNASAALPGSSSATIVGAASAGTLFAYMYTDALYVSTVGGKSWSPVRQIPRSDVSFIGFETGQVGRVVTNDGRTIWTTRDAGQSWSAVDFR